MNLDPEFLEVAQLSTLYGLASFAIGVFCWTVYDFFDKCNFNKQIKAHPEIRPLCEEINSLHFAYSVLRRDSPKQRGALKQAYQQHYSGLLESAPEGLERIAKQARYRTPGERVLSVLPASTLRDFAPQIETLLVDTGRTIEDIKDPNLYRKITAIKAGEPLYLVQ